MKTDWSQVGSPVGDQIYSQVDRQVWEQVWGDIYNPIHFQVYREIGHMVWDEKTCLITFLEECAAKRENVHNLEPNNRQKR